MENQFVQHQLKKSMGFTSLQWQNQTRMFYERWAMVTAAEQCVLLEDLSRSESVWNWYKTHFYKCEENFYIQHSEYIHTINAPDELFEVFTLMAHDIESIYPLTLIQHLKNGKTAIN